MESIGAYFVTRAKFKMQYRIIKKAKSTDEGALANHLMLLTGPKSSQLYPKLLWAVHYHDTETNEEPTSTSNNLDINALDIANIYRNS